MSLMKIKRSSFLLSVAAASVALVYRIPGITALLAHSRNPGFPFIRPPGTENEDEFLSKCIRCRACGDVCEAGCIKFFSFTDGPALAGSPYLITRLKSCNLCTNCGHVCPTGALKPIEKGNREEIAKKVRMGTAIVVESNCLSYNGRVCGVCHDACPLKGHAIKLKPVAKPVIDEKVCIGCGRCDEICPQLPSAIPVIRKDTDYV